MPSSDTCRLDSFSTSILLSSGNPRAPVEQEHEEEQNQSLPGVDFTPEQLFFINYAQIWCGKMNDQEAKRKLLTSEHCPGSIRYCVTICCTTVSNTPHCRVRGPLTNFQEFARVFNCPVGSRMNPPHAQKCQVW